MWGYFYIRLDKKFRETPPEQKTIYIYLCEGLNWTLIISDWTEFCRLLRDEKFLLQNLA